MGERYSKVLVLKGEIGIFSRWVGLTPFIPLAEARGFLWVLNMKVTTKTAPEVIEVAKRAFPNYTGRKYSLEVFKGPKRLDSCWDGGSRDTYKVIPLTKSTTGMFKVPENGTPFSNDGIICELSDLPEGLALVCHCIFCGRDIGLTVYVNANNMNQTMIGENK